MGKLNKKFKRYIILAEDKDGKLYGYCKNTFSMDWREDRVNIFNLDKKYWNSKKINEWINKIQKKHPEWKISLYRVGSKYCPIKIYWPEWWDIQKKKKEWSNYKIRNPRFIKRVPGWKD